MTLYNNSAFGPPYKNTMRMGTSIQPNYLFGAFEYKTEPFRFAVTGVALASNVATYTVQLIGGGGPAPSVAPAVGAKMGVRGTATSSGLFNVDPAIVTAVTFNATTGAGTISCALTGANVSQTADTGVLVVNPVETPDKITGVVSSQAVALIFTPDESDNSRCLFAECKWVGTLPTTATVVLEAANVDDDSRYVNLGTVCTVASGAVTQAGAEFSFIMGKFLRLKVSAFTGGDSTTGLVGTVFA